MWDLLVAFVQTVTAVGAVITGLASPVTLGWDPPTGVIVGYRVTVDGTTTNVGLPTNNALCGCPAFAFPLPAGPHVASVLAYNNTGEGPSSAPLSFTIVDGGAPPGAIPNFIFISDIPAPPLNTWLSTNVGNSTSLGTSSILNGVWTLTSSGTQLSGRNDSLHYVYHLVTGDGGIQVRVDSLVTGGANAKAGVTWRASTDSNSAHVSLTTESNGTITLKSRQITGGSTIVTLNEQVVQLPVWLRLDRITSLGQVLGSYSIDGETWVGSGYVTISMPATTTYGLVEWSTQAGLPAVGLFTSLTRD